MFLQFKSSFKIQKFQNEKFMRLFIKVKKRRLKFNYSSRPHFKAALNIELLYTISTFDESFYSEMHSNYAYTIGSIVLIHSNALLYDKATAAKPESGHYIYKAINTCGVVHFVLIF